MTAEELSVYMRVTATLIALPLDPNYEKGILEHLSHLQACAELIMGWPLSDDAEIAPVFRP
jgi:hypothetical protein